MDFEELWVKFNTRFDNVEKGLQAMQTQGKQVDSVWKKIGNTIKTVFSFFAVQRVIQWGKALLNMGADTEANQRRAAAAIQAVGMSVDKILPKINAYAQQMLELGYDDDAVVASMGRLINVTKDYDKALAINAVALDYARYKGVDLNTATLDLIRAFNGQTRAVKEMGIPLAEGAKGMEVIGAIAQRVRGQAAAFADTIAGKMEIVRQKLSNIGEDVGIALFPAVAKILDVAGSLASTLAPVFVQLAGVISDTLTALEPLLTGIGQLLVRAVQDAQPILQILIQAIARIGQVLAPLIPLLSDLMGRILAALTPVVEELVLALLDVIDALVPLIPLWIDFYNQVFGLIAPALPGLASVIRQVVVPAMQLIGVAVAAAVGAFKGMIDSGRILLNSVRQTWQGIWRIIKTFAESIGQVVVALGEVIMGVLTLNPKRIETGWGNIKNALGRFGEAWEQGIDQIVKNNLVTATIQAGKTIGDAVKSSIYSYLDVVDAAGKRGTSPTPAPAPTGGGATPAGVPPLDYEYPDITGDKRNEALEKYLKLLDHEIAMGQVSIAQEINRLRVALELTKTEEERWAIEERIYQLEQQMAEDAAEAAEKLAEAAREARDEWSAFLQDWVKGGFKMEDIWDRIMANMLKLFIDNLMAMAAASDSIGLFDALGSLLGLSSLSGGAVSGFTINPYSGGQVPDIQFYRRGGIVPDIAMAARGMVVPRNRRTQPALLHAKEMVLPPELSQGIQRLIASGGRGDQYYVEIHAVDAPSFVQLLSRREARDPIVMHIGAEARQKGQRR